MKPIIFNTEMVRAILEGRKTQTRRVIKPQPSWYNRFNLSLDWLHKKRLLTRLRPSGLAQYCPYGKVGDKLWVRETFQKSEHLEDFPLPDEYLIKKDGSNNSWNVNYKANVFGKWLSEYSSVPWEPSIHMPRWASRITLETTDIRVERVQGISEGDAKAEGILLEHYNSQHRLEVKPYRSCFKWLWNSINEKRGYGWDKNPYVWVVSFKRLIDE